MIQMPEVGHSHGPHGHGTGLPWLDIVIAVSAVFISVVSLVVSIEHGRTMEKMVEQNQKMVEANTLPLLTESKETTINPIDPTKSHFSIILKNNGIGPAIIERFEVRYKGKLYAKLPELLEACCAAEVANAPKALPSTYGAITGTILPAHDSETVLEVAPETVELQKAILSSAADLSMDACYCSVLDKCWKTNFDQRRPIPVAECKAGAEEKLW
jgi:hypothetical protein